MKIVATMIVRNESDVIRETVTEIKRYVDHVIVLDGGSDDGTIEILRSMEVDLHCVNSGTEWKHNEERHMLHELAKGNGADWVITVDADEIYHTNPVPYVEAADKAGATLLSCHIPQFLFTEKELLEGTLQTEDSSLSVQERRKWYGWGWSDMMIYKMQPGLTYLGAKDGRITRPPYYGPGSVRVVSDFRPILKHYQYRSLQQYAKKIKNRRLTAGKNHKRWFRWTFENPFYNERSLHYFDGQFRNERGDRVDPQF